MPYLQVSLLCLSAWLLALTMSCTSFQGEARNQESGQKPPSIPTQARAEAIASATVTVTPPRTAKPGSQPTFLTVQALGRFFFPGQLQAQSGSEVTVEFQNEDPGVVHDLSFRIPGLPGGATCTGPCSYSYTFIAPEPGRYEFFCTVHPYIVGRLIVEP